MSKNFELLHRAAEEELFIPGGLPTPVSLSAPSRSFAAEPVNTEIAKLVQQLFFHGGRAGGPRIVSFCGISRGDRSSWICARAAEAVASQGDASVCVVDADFQSPQLHTHFGIGNRAGLADALSNEGPIRNFAIPVSGRSLWVIAAGAIKGGLCTQVERSRARFAELREEFNHILISAPSLVYEAETALTGQLADGTVLIVEANQSRREAVRRAKEQLESSQVRLLGAVLDQRTFPIPEFLYRKL